MKEDSTSLDKREEEKAGLAATNQRHRRHEQGSSAVGDSAKERKSRLALKTGNCAPLDLFSPTARAAKPVTGAVIDRYWS